MEVGLYKRGFDDDIVNIKQKLLETSLLLEVLSHVNALITTSKSFEGFCMEVGNVLKDKFKFKYIHIWIRDKQNYELLRLVTPETANGYRTASVNEGILGRAIREAKTVCTPNVLADPDYINVHGETKSELCIPLSFDEKVMGAINIETDTLQNFAGHIAVMELIAANLGHSLKLALLYQTEEYFHRLVEQMSEGVWVGDKEEFTIYTNPALQKMTGYSEEEFLAKHSYDFFDEPSRKIIQTEIEKRKHGIGSHYEATIVTKDGNFIHVIIHAVPFGKGGTMATITDLNPVKTAERKLLHAERFLASITQFCAEAIIGLDEKGLIQTWNIGAEKMFGFKVEEAIGKSPEQFLVPEDRVSNGEFQQLIQEVKMKGLVRNFESVRIHKNGKPISVSLTFSAVKDDSGAIIGISALYRDITAQKKWEHELQDRFVKMQDAYKEMGKQRRYLDYLVDMITMAGDGNHSAKQIANFVVNALVMITRVDAATLRLLDEKSGKLVLSALSGLGEEWWSKKSILYSGSLLESSVKNGHPLKILDILNDPHYSSPSLARKNNLRSALIVPIEAKGEVLGSLTLYLSHESNLSLLDDEFISIFVKQAALAMKLAN